MYTEHVAKLNLTNESYAKARLVLVLVSSPKGETLSRAPNLFQSEVLL